MRYLLTGLLLITATTNAQIYKCVDTQGRTHYYDTPCQRSGSAPVALQALNLQPALSAPTPASLKHHRLPEQEPLSAVYTDLEVQGLPSNQALRANNGTFTVHINVQPPLSSHHHLQLVLNDRPYGQPDTRTDLQLVNVDRGEHQLAVRVLEGDTMVQQSNAVRFYVQRFHLKR